VIILVGFMGCGKSTLGPLLALCLNLPFRDLDRVVAAEAGTDAAGIFAAEGEEGFRRREAAAFRALAGSFPGVLAVGGGLPCQPGMAAELAAAGDCLYLDLPVEELEARLLAGAAPRPLLAALPAAERPAAIRALHARRDPCYRRAGRVVPLPAGEDAVRHLDRLLAALGRRPEDAA